MLQYSWNTLNGALANFSSLSPTTHLLLPAASPGVMTQSRWGSINTATEYRSAVSGLATRWATEWQKPLVQTSVMSHILTTNVSSIGGTSIQWSSLVFICKPHEEKTVKDQTLPLCEAGKLSHIIIVSSYQHWAQVPIEFSCTLWLFYSDSSLIQVCNRLSKKPRFQLSRSIYSEIQAPELTAVLEYFAITVLQNKSCINGSTPCVNLRLAEQVHDGTVPQG